MARITADICENRGKITASIHTPKRDIFISTRVYIVIGITGIENIM